MTQRLLMFDLDGTLVDSRQDLTTAVNLTLADYALPPLPLEQVTSFIGDGSRQLMARCLGGADVNVDDATDRLGVHYGRHLLDETTLYEGVVDLLAIATQQGCQLAVVTNKSEDSARNVVSGLGIASWFRLVLGDDGKRKLKPCPDPIAEVLDNTGAQPHETWMIGDNYTDLAAGHAGGVKTCFCEYGFGKARGETSDLQIASPMALADALFG